MEKICKMKRYNKLLVFIVGVLLVIIWGMQAHISTDNYVYDALDYYKASKSFCKTESLIGILTAILIEGMYFHLFYISIWR